MKNNILRFCTSFLLLMILIPVLSRAQFTISAHIQGLSEGMIYIDYSGHHNDSTMVSNGDFEFKGAALDGPNYCTLVTKDNQFLTMLWVNNGEDIKIICKKGERSQVTGAKLEDEYQLYCQHMKPILDKERAFVKQAKEAFNAGHKDQYEAMEQEFETKLKREEDSVFIEFAKAHPSSHICLNHIYNCRVLNKYDFARYDAMYRLLTPGAFQGKQWNTFLGIYNKDKSLQSGEEMPEFTLPDVSGIPVSLSKYRGKYVLFTIGSSKLKDYISMLPAKKELYKAYGKEKIEIVDMLFDESEEAPLKVMTNNDVAWTLLCDYKGFDSPVAKLLGVDHICQNYLIDPHGKIVARNIFGDELKKQVESQFK